MIYLYGLRDLRPNDARLAAIKGVTGPVSASETLAGWLVHGPSDGTELLPKRRHLLAHTRVLEALGEEATILPMRFGMMADSVSQFAGLMAEHKAEIAEAFDRLTGQIELGLRVDFPKDAALQATLDTEPELARTHARLARMSPAPHFEAAEFGRVLAEAMDHRRSAAQSKLLETLKPHITDYVIKKPEEDVQVLALDVLIRESTQASFTKLLASAAQGVADFANGAEPTIKIVGPVPAFSFVNLTLSHAAAA